MVLKLSNTPPPYPKFTMTSPIGTVKEEINEKNWIKTKGGVGSDIKAEIGYIEENTREEITRRIRKEVVVCV